jgi:hypothetical protein
MIYAKAVSQELSEAPAVHCPIGSQQSTSLMAKGHSGGNEFPTVPPFPILEAGHADSHTAGNQHALRRVQDSILLGAWKRVASWWISAISCEPLKGRIASCAWKADNRTVAEILASPGRSLAKALTVVNQTLGTLNEQTEQLHQISAGADDVINNLGKSAFLLQRKKPFGWVKNIFKKDRFPACRGQVPANRLSSIKSQYLVFFTHCTQTNWRRACVADVHYLDDDMWVDDDSWPGDDMWMSVL